jgi:hypothetical protein
MVMIIWGREKKPEGVVSVTCGEFTVPQVTYVTQLSGPGRRRSRSAWATTGPA